MNLNEFYKMINDICPTYHFESDLEQFPRQVYTEYSTVYEYASNNVYNKVTSVNLSHFSKDEFDKTEKLLELMLMVKPEITFNKETEFDQETKVITNSYDIEISESLDEQEVLNEIEELKNKIKEDE